MRHLPSRYRRLDGALAALPLEEPMLLSELDGFLTGILIAPERLAPDEWMQRVWGSDDGSGVAPFEDPLDVRWFAEAVLARYREIERALARGKLQPIFDVDERFGDILWETWIDALAAALDLRPDGWDRLAARDGAAAARLAVLVAAADGSSTLDSVEINALHDHAPAEITRLVLALHAGRATGAAAPAAPTKVGRNDPCRCGSGRKAKKCCGEGHRAAA